MKVVLYKKITKTDEIEEYTIRCQSREASRPSRADRLIQYLFSKQRESEDDADAQNSVPNIPVSRFILAA
jgi:hypothetical protein